MEGNLNSIIYLLIVAIIILLGVVAGLVYLLVKKRKMPKKLWGDSSDPVPMEANCHWHTKKEAVGICAICSKSLCQTCLKQWEKLQFCPEHFRTFGENKWIYITNLKTTPEDPGQVEFLFRMKQQLWKEQELPTYIVTHYKIDIETDEIESYVMLYCRSQDIEVIEPKLQGHVPTEIGQDLPH